MMTAPTISTAGMPPEVRDAFNVVTRWIMTTQNSPSFSRMKPYPDAASVLAVGYNADIGVGHKGFAEIEGVGPVYSDGVSVFPVTLGAAL